MNTVVILQSNYIPWKGYFDLIYSADLFIFYDDIQYSKGTWRNRNKIKTPDGAKWITIPVGKNAWKNLICEVELNDSGWQQQHWSKIEENYKESKYFEKYYDLFFSIYNKRTWKNLSELNQTLTIEICKLLKIETRIEDSRKYSLKGKKLERLVNLLLKVDATEYVSGPCGMNYIEKTELEQNNIKLIYKEYSGYPEYSQLHPPFDHNVSILDLLFNMGDDSSHYIWGWR